MSVQTGSEKYGSRKNESYEFEIQWPSGKVWRRARTREAAQHKIDAYLRGQQPGDADPGFKIVEVKK